MHALHSDLLKGHMKKSAHLRINAWMVFKCNHNGRFKLVDLGKFWNLIDSSYKFHTILAKRGGECKLIHLTKFRV